MRAAHVRAGHLARAVDANDLWSEWDGAPRLEAPPRVGRAVPRLSPEEEPAVQAHEELFTSGAYVREFQPEAAANPFAAVYARKRLAVIEAVTGADKRVLDVGGGMGRMSIPLSRSHFVTLTDISSQMLDLARPYACDRLRLKQADVNNLPFQTNGFDIALCIDVLPHVKDPYHALNELKRVLKPGGKLVVDVTNAVPLWTLAYPRYLGRRPGRWLQIWQAGGVLPEWRSRVRHHTRRQLLEFLAGTGFQVESTRGFGPAGCPKWYLAVAVKP
jgi:glycogen(starch) synthase